MNLLWLADSYPLREERENSFLLSLAIYFLAIYPSIYPSILPSIHPSFHSSDKLDTYHVPDSVLGTRDMVVNRNR